MKFLNKTGRLDKWNTRSLARILSKALMDTRVNNDIDGWTRAPGGGLNLAF
jgi:hypothetical protein